MQGFSASSFSTAAFSVLSFALDAVVPQVFSRGVYFSPVPHWRGPVEDDEALLMLRLI